MALYTAWVWEGPNAWTDQTGIAISIITAFGAPCVSYQAALIAPAESFLHFAYLKATRAGFALTNH